MGLADLIKNTLDSAFPGTSAATGGTPVPQAASKLGWFDAAKMTTVGGVIAVAVVTVWPSNASQAADYAGYGQTICIGLAAAFGAFVLAVRKLKK
jgi:hypothetical protein